MEEQLDRAEERVASLTAQVNSTETERDEAERRLRSLENLEATSSEKCFDQVKYKHNCKNNFCS